MVVTSGKTMAIPNYIYIWFVFYKVINCTSINVHLVL